MRKPTLTDRLVSRHRITHPTDSAYKISRHIKLPLRTTQLATKRIRERVGIEKEKLLEFLIQNPIPHKRFEFFHPNPNVWLRRPPVQISYSGEDAAAVLGWNLIPNRHILYVAEKDLDILLKDLLDNGGRLSGDNESNLSIRLRDKWMIDDPSPLVERGQRLVDYRESKNIQILTGLQEGRWD
jgi:hypothetical protein